MSKSPDQQRQPKGTSKGGQFAPSKNPEASVVLNAEGGGTISMADAIERIHRHLADDGLFDPNEQGLDLINRSRMEVTGELQTLDGIAWTGRITIGEDVLEVSNSGNGGPNNYSMAPPGDWRRIEEINDLVSDGFPRLRGPEALDDFCLVVEVVRTD